MDIFNSITIIICITALFAYLNVKYIKLPNTIGLMLLSIIFSVLIGFANFINPELFNKTIQSIDDLDFSRVVIDVLLSFLLFAGALHTDFDLLKSQSRSIILFALFGVFISTALIGCIVYGIGVLFHIDIPFIYCLLFGSFISPTDPIAVLGILTKTNVPKKLEINIVGESLFNDGIAVVIFITILSLIYNGTSNIGVWDIAKTFVVEAIGGILLGIAIGYATFFALKKIDDYETEVIITLAAVMGGSLLASFIHVSAPLAMVVAGLITGHKSKEEAMSDITALYVDKFWHLIDVLLNAVLFVLMGLKFISIPLKFEFFLIAVILIPLLIIARYAALFIPFQFAKKYIDITQKDLTLMTWGGLRGGLSIAMALSLSDDIAYKPLFATLTYAIVIFSIFIQGLSIQKLANKVYSKKQDKF